MQSQHAVEYQIDGQTVSLMDHQCAWCDSSAVERSAYKGTEALVCADCETPVFRSW